MSGPPDERGSDAPPDDSTAQGDGSTDPRTEGMNLGERVRGRHLGKPADARRATRPATHPAHRVARPAASAPSVEPVLPDSPDDSDVGWGARPDPDDDERLLRDVPPHWQ